MFGNRRGRLPWWENYRNGCDMAERQRVLLLTGASRGIGHATVKTFSDAGWRVLTLSRHPFDPRCPWEGGAKNHVQLILPTSPGCRLKCRGCATSWATVWTR